MKKLLFLFVLITTSSVLFSQGVWVVQVGAFDQKLPLSYFSGLTGVYEVKDHNDIHRYYIGGFKNKTEAQAGAENAKKLGFKAFAIDMESIQQQCNASCREDNAGWIYFDYNGDALRAESKRKLQRLADILKANPGYKATLTGHTDAHGSDEYNKDLSKRRVENSKNYLASLGIDAKRLTLDHFGEAKPIAKNEVNGHDTPAGRQFNRRVELTIFDEKGLEKTDMMQEAEVPASLRN